MLTKKVRTPTYVRLVGFTGEDIQAREKSRFADLIAATSAQPVVDDDRKNPVVATRKGWDAVYEIHVKLLVGNDYGVHQIWVTPEDDNYMGTWAEPEKIVERFPLAGEAAALFKTGVCVCSEPITSSMIDEIFNSAEAARSLIRFSTLELLMSDAAQIEVRYWLSPSKRAALPTAQDSDLPSLSKVEKQRVSETLDDIARIEVYRHKIMGFNQDFTVIHQSLVQIEKEVSEQLKKATRGLHEAKPFELREMLYQVSGKLVEIAALARALENDSSSAASNLSNLKSVFRRWGEQPIVDSRSVSSVFLDSAEIVPEAYTRLAEKVKAVRVEMNNVTNVIRTKVDLEQQGDILLIQRGLDWLQVFVLTDIFFRFGTETLLKETFRELIPIVREFQPLVLLGSAFIAAVIVVVGIKWVIQLMAKR